MQFLRRKGGKVHYNALFGDGKDRKRSLNAEFAETQRKDLRGAKARRRGREVFNLEAKFG
jgi:hypothetical protein